MSRSHPFAPVPGQAKTSSTGTENGEIAQYSTIALSPPFRAVKSRRRTGLLLFLAISVPATILVPFWANGRLPFQARHAVLAFDYNFIAQTYLTKETYYAKHARSGHSCAECRNWPSDELPAEAYALEMIGRDSQVEAWPLGGQNAVAGYLLMRARRVMWTRESCWHGLMAGPWREPIPPSRREAQKPQVSSLSLMMIYRPK